MALIQWLDRNIEKLVIFICYSSMAGIVFVEVIRRFVFSQQAAWSTTIPIYLFLWITWVGASYNVKIRTHLKFDELRIRLPYLMQFSLQVLDAVLWSVFGIIVVVYSTEQVYLARENFMIVQGTDNVLQWWFYVATPAAWVLLIFRILQNLWEDIQLFRAGKPLSIQNSIDGG